MFCIAISTAAFISKLASEPPGRRFPFFPPCFLSLAPLKPVFLTLPPFLLLSCKKLRGGKKTFALIKLWWHGHLAWSPHKGSPIEVRKVRDYTGQRESSLTRLLSVQMHVVLGFQGDSIQGQHHSSTVYEIIQKILPTSPPILHGLNFPPFLVLGSLRTDLKAAPPPPASPKQVLYNGSLLFWGYKNKQLWLTLGVKKLSDKHVSLFGRLQQAKSCSIFYALLIPHPEAQYIPID